MKKIAFLFPVLFFLGFSNLQANTIDTYRASVQDIPNGKYALVISFISIGGGIDGISLDKITEYINNHPKKPVVIIDKKGREGERTIYLKLNELSKSEKKAFIENIEKLIVNKDLVKIQKNITLKTVKEK